MKANPHQRLQTDAAETREEDNRLVSADQLAARLKLSMRTLERMRHNGSGPRFTKIGNKVLYREADVEAWLAERSFGSTAEAKRAQR